MIQASGGDAVVTGMLDNSGETPSLNGFSGNLVTNGTIKGGGIELRAGAALVPRSRLILDGVTLAVNYEVLDSTEMLVRNEFTLDGAQLAFRKPWRRRPGSFFRRLAARRYGRDLQVYGAYMQTNSSVLSVIFDGAVAGTQYERWQISGTVNLDRIC